MTLQELQKMIKEELDSFVQNENTENLPEADMDETAPVDEVDVDVDTDAGDIDAEEKNPEDALQKIFDMLKDYFEGEDEAEGDLGDEETTDEDVEETYMEDKETDLEELANHGVGKSASNSSGANAGYTPAKSTKGDGKLHEGARKDKTKLQERFQKLANIIK